MHTHTRIRWFILFILCFCVLSGPPEETLGQEGGGEKVTLEQLQQQIIRLRREFKARMAQAEQDRELVKKTLQKKFQQFAEEQDAFSQKPPQVTQQAKELLASLEGFETQLAAFEQSLERLDTTMTHNLETLKSRLAQVKRQGVPRQTVTAPVPSAEEATPPAEQTPASSSSFDFSPGQLFRAAYRIYMDGDYEIAIAGFQKYLEEYPNTQLAGAAQYWIAESLSRLEEYDIAIQEYERLIQQYPGNDKIADAQYGIGAALMKLEQTDAARQKFQDVVSHFPDTIAARKAQSHLNRLR